MLKKDKMEVYVVLRQSLEYLPVFACCQQQVREVREVRERFHVTLLGGRKNNGDSEAWRKSKETTFWSQAKGDHRLLHNNELTRRHHDGELAAIMGSSDRYADADKSLVLNC